MSHGRITRHSPFPKWLALAVGVALAFAPGCQRSPFRRPNAVPEAVGTLAESQTNPIDLAGSPVAEKPVVPRPPTPLLDSALARADAARFESESERPESIPVELPPESTPKAALAAPAVQTAKPTEVLKTEVAPTVKVDRPVEPAPTIVTPPPPRLEWADGLEHLRELAREKAGKPGGEGEGWTIRARVLDWLAGDAPKPDAPQRAVWTSVLTALTVATSAETPEPAELSRTLREAIESLETLKPLELAEVRICRKVEGYAVFDPIDPKTLKAGQSLLLYCEATGVRYEPADEAFHSRLAANVELLPVTGGAAVWSESLDTAEEFCRKRRRDYYINYRLTLPTTLAAGDYLLRFHLVDQLSGQPATTEIKLTLTP